MSEISGVNEISTQSDSSVEDCIEKFHLMGLPHQQFTTNKTWPKIAGQNESIHSYYYLCSKSIIIINKVWEEEIKLS
jgi:hypothetical protein